MLKRIALTLTALVLWAGLLPALAADPSPGQGHLRVLATRTVRAAGRHSLGPFLILAGAAVVVWLVLRRRAARMGYPHYPGRYPAGTQPRANGPAGYPGGYMPGSPGIMGHVAGGLATVPPADGAPEPDRNAHTAVNEFRPDDAGSRDGAGD